MKKFIFVSALIISLSLTLFNTNIFASEIKYNIKSFDESSLIQSDGSYWVWGNNQTVPIQIHGLTDVEKSFNYQLVMKEDKTVWFWERDSSGATQISNVKALNNLVDVQTAWSDILALDQEGKVFLLSKDGRINSEQLNQISPLLGIDNIVDISSYVHTYYVDDRQSVNIQWVFLKNDGTVWVNKERLPTESFEQIQSLDNVIDIDQNIALKQDGTVWTWLNELYYKEKYL